MGSVAETQPFDFIVVGGKCFCSPTNQGLVSNIEQVELQETQ
jgi:hypothetical protein